MARDPNHLTPSGDGRWCKRVRGKLRHFGNIGGTKDEALADWLRLKNDLLAGRAVRREPVKPSVLTVQVIVDRFLTAWGQKVRDRKIRGATFDDYDRALYDFGAVVGPGRDPADLRPEDFRAAREAWDKRMGPWAIDRNVQAVRTMFRWAVDVARLLERPPWYGDQFGKSSEGEKRLAAREKARVRGERRFTIEELSVILAEAGAPLKAMVLLGLNGGMYATDIARLRRSDLKRDGKLWVVDFDRTKTGGVWWKFPLWPETKRAIDEAAALCRVAREPANADLLFLTVRGNAWHRENVRDDEAGMIDGVSETHGVGQELDKILDLERKRSNGKTWKLRRAGVGFGSLRHTHRSATGNHPDLHAARRVVGHRHGSIEKHYDHISIERLKAVTDLARVRLLLPALAAVRSSQKAPPAARSASPARAGDPRRRRAADAPA